MNPMQFVLTPAARSTALNVVGTKVTVLVSDANSKSHQITLQSGDEGTGPPPHSHDWDESFYVLKGTVEFTCSGKNEVCAPGTLVHIPAGTVHSFRYGSDGGEMLEFTGQGGFATKMFTAVSETMPPGVPKTDDVPKLLDVLKQNGVTVSDLP